MELAAMLIVPVPPEVLMSVLALPGLDKVCAVMETAFAVTPTTPVAVLNATSPLLAVREAALPAVTGAAMLRFAPAPKMETVPLAATFVPVTFVVAQFPAE